MHLGNGFKDGCPRFKLDVRFQAEYDLVIVEHGMTWQLHELLFRLRVHVDHAILDQYHFIGLFANFLNRRPRHVNPSIEINYELVAETLFATVEEVLKLLHEVAEDLIDELSL